MTTAVADAAPDNVPAQGRRRYTSAARAAYTQAKSVISRVEASPDSSATKRTMAELRRGVGKTVAQTPALWPYVIRRDAGTRTEQANDASENATHIALTLWALHSQGSGPTANREDMSFGRAMNELHAIVGGDTVPAHFASLLAARNDIVRERHLRSLVGLMRAKGIGFDYPALAADLADLHGRTSSDRVKRHWARSYASAFPLSTPYPTDAQE